MNLPKVSLVFFFLLISLSACGINEFLVKFGENKYENKQQELANELGVKIENYPYPKSFPSGYYYSLLKPGMTLEEVHELVRGYYTVCHFKSMAEIYTYYGDDLKSEEVRRFELRYDEERKYMKFVGEEPDSRTLWSQGCQPGLISEQ